MGDSDIDSFIAQQKAKLAAERQTLNDEPGSYNTNRNQIRYDEGRERQKWAKFDSGNAPPLAEQPSRQQPGVSTPVESGLPLTNRGQEERQRALAKERRREYNEMIEKKGSQPGRGPNPNAPPVRAGLDVGRYEDERKLLDKERHKDYNDFLEQKRMKASSQASQYDNQPSYNETKENRNYDAGKFNYVEQKKQLAEERRKEYNDMLQQKTNARRTEREQEIDNPSIIPFNRVEQEKLKARLMEEERQREYNEAKSRMPERTRKREVTPVQNFDPQALENEKRLQKEREQREYKAMLDKQQENRKQMMLLQQGVPYEKVSKMTNESTANQSRPSDFLRQDFSDRNVEPQSVPYDYGNDSRSQLAKRESQVQFDLDSISKYSPHPAPQSRHRQYEDRHPQDLLDDRRDPEPYQRQYQSPQRQRSPERQQQQQQQPPDQFCILGFGRYDDHKQKLKEERKREFQEHLAKKNPQNKMNQATYRQQWENLHQGEEVEGLHLSSIDETPRSIDRKYKKMLEEEDYKKQWAALGKERKKLKQNSERKQWDRPSDLKLTPSGRLDTNSIIQDVVREKDMASYRSEWRKLHQQDNSQNQTSPRIEKMKQGNSQQRLDTNSIIREVLGEKQAEQEPRRRRGDADAGLNLNPINTGNNMGGEDNYRRQWEQRQNQQNFASDPPRYGDSVAYQSARNIDNNIAQAQREVDDYRQKWEQMQGKERRNKNIGNLPERKHFEDFSLHRTNSAYEEKKKRLKLEQKKDLKEFLEKSPPSSRLARHTSADYRKRVSQSRNREYNEFLRKKNEVEATNNRTWHTPETAADEQVLPLGRYDKTHRRYEELRKQEMQEYLYKNQQNPVQYYKPDSESQLHLIGYKGKENEDFQRAHYQDQPLPLGGYELMRKKLNEERRREYNEFMAQSKVGVSPRSQGLGGRGGAVLIQDEGRLSKVKKMEEERNREYNELIAAKRNYPNNSGLRDQTDDFKSGTLPGNESDSVKWQKRKQRNEEYNEFLANKNQKDRHRFDDKRQAPRDSGQVNSLPHLNYSNSAQRRHREEERNREYNEMIQQRPGRQRGGPPDVKTGWGTPDYNDILAKKRANEQTFRRANDIAFEADPMTRQTEVINRALDRDLEATKAAYKRERIYNLQPGQGVLDDPYWLSSTRYPHRAYYNRDYPHWHPHHRRYHDYWEENRANPIKQIPRQNNANGPPSVRRSQDQGGEYFASLPLGYSYSRPVLYNGRNSESAQRRQKNQLGNDLKMQMAETQQARQLERREGILVNNNSILRQQPPAKATPRNYDPYYSVLKNVSDYDQLSPRANALLGRRQPTSERLRDKGGLNFNGDNGAGILDMGLFNKPRTTAVDPPAELVYQPSTFITANAIPTLNNSVDDAYNFYASKNPLDPDLKGDPVPQQGGGQRNVPSLNLSGVGGDLRGPASKVRFQDSRQNGPAQGMEFSTDDDRKKGKKQTSEDYREELKRQMAENDAKKRRAREERERYEMKMEEEAKYYDPFGKGGGGAPMRDATGNVISDLRQIRSDNLNPLSNRGGREVREVPSFNLPEKSPRGGNSYRDDLIGPPPTQTTAGGDPSFARGGHGIFGMPKTDVEKTQADKYKIDLKRQIEEKKAEEYRKKQLEKLEEEREQKLLDEQRARIQSEYEEEQRRTQEKKEEARRKNEEMMRAAEEKKRELERQKREEEDRRQEQIREQRDREMQERQREEEAKRGKSPPIPALRGKESNEEEKQEPEPKRTSHSPPIPAVRTRTPAGDESRQEHTAYPQRAQSADVLNQLTRLRAELRKESDRVQTMLHDQEDDVQIYDPRQIQRPPPGPVVVNPRTEIDVFETAKNRNPVVLRRTPNERANSRAVEDFNALKHKADTDSRKQFREMYPIEPTTSGALEAQQAALLQQQEERLRYMKDRRALEDTSALRVPGRDIHSSSSQLHSNSAFVDVNGIGHFPDDFEDIPRRNDSARYRRRTRIPSSPQIERLPSPDFNSRATFGSQTSLNVDKMARKNEDRLRKLRDLQGDDLSLYDPEDVLDRFMTKQGHNRPPSRNTLLDDTWMRAGSKRSEY